jgi:hypothetical protein
MVAHRARLIPRRGIALGPMRQGLQQADGTQDLRTTTIPCVRTKL